MSLARFGVIGLGVMGRNLALNIEEHGFPVAVWNLEPDWTDNFLRENAGKQFTGTKTFEEFVAALERPRCMLMMIAAGKPIDMTIEKLAGLLEPGDIVIDGGNSWFKDTQRRGEYLKQKGIHFVGCGTSGGEEGARFGPSLMPAGDHEAWPRIQPVYEAIAAKSDSGACVTWVGTDGAGHYVKMVHNGIEYGDMQLIAEAYELLRKGLGADANELASIFEEWNRGPLSSFLIEITAKIFRVRDPETGAAMVDVILDKAGQKGTGKWTAQVALDLAVPVPTIAAAIDARVLSSMKDERVRASEEIRSAVPPAKLEGEERKAFVQNVHDALLAAKICSYAQGMALIQAGSKEWSWGIQMHEIARIWTAGCIIRAKFLDEIMTAYSRDAQLSNLLLDPAMNAAVSNAEHGWRATTSFSQLHGIPVPAMSASLAYYDSYRSAQLPQNLTQAQRDFFGAHTFQRTDKGPNAPFVHFDWE